MAIKFSDLSRLSRNNQHGNLYAILELLLSRETVDQVSAVKTFQIRIYNAWQNLQGSKCWPAMTVVYQRSLISTLCLCRHILSSIANLHVASFLETLLM